MIKNTRLTPQQQPYKKLLEPSVIGTIFLVYIFSFNISSSVNGPPEQFSRCIIWGLEIFGQDSEFILKALWNLSTGEVERLCSGRYKHMGDYYAGGKYPWNPNSHLLYHIVIEQIYLLWVKVFPSTPLSTYWYLKILTALSGLGFLLTFRKLLQEIGLKEIQRSIFLVITGLSIGPWFHFAAFETHSLGMVVIPLCLLAILRITKTRGSSRKDYWMLGSSLLLLGLFRADLWRFLLVSIVFIAHPKLAGLRFKIFTSLACAAVIGALTTSALGSFYYDRIFYPQEVFGRVIFEEGTETKSISTQLTTQNLLTTARSFTVYGVLMPVVDTSTTPLELWYKNIFSFGGFLAVDYFSEPLTTMLKRPSTSFTLLGLLYLFGLTLIRAIKKLINSDPFIFYIVIQFVPAWLFYTWFNPYEPFVFNVEFVPMNLAAIAALTMNSSRNFWIFMGILALAITLHNAYFFVLLFQ